MSIFERWSRGGREEAAQEHIAKLTLAAVDSIQDPERAEQKDLAKAGVTAETLQIIVERVSLSTEQKEKILALANRPEIKKNLPVYEAYDRDQLVPLPDRETLAHNLEPLSERELEDAYTEFEAALNDKQRPLPIFVRGKVNSEGQQGLMDQAERQRMAKTLGIDSTTVIGEQTILIDQLKPGYVEVEKALGTRALKDLFTTSAPFLMQGRRIDARYSTQDRRRWQELEALVKKLEANPAEPRALTTITRDVYIPLTPRTDVTAIITDAQSKRHLVRQLTGKEIPVKCVGIYISDATNPTGMDERTGYLSILILFGHANPVNRALAQGTSHMYRTFLRALRTSPGFFVEALRKYRPSVFDPGNKSEPSRRYYGEEGRSWEPEEMTMRLEVPELEAVGEPVKRTFRKS